MSSARVKRKVTSLFSRFGTHISGGDTVSRCIRLNNPTPFGKGNVMVQTNMLALQSLVIKAQPLTDDMINFRGRGLF